MINFSNFKQLSIDIGYSNVLEDPLTKIKHKYRWSSSSNAWKDQTSTNEDKKTTVIIPILPGENIIRWTPSAVQGYGGSYQFMYFFNNDELTDGIEYDSFDDAWDVENNYLKIENPSGYKYVSIPFDYNENITPSKMILTINRETTGNGVSLKELFINGIQVWKAATYKNWVKYSTEADGVTIYNSVGEGATPGYKQKTRVRSGGGETGHGNATCTGYIKVNPGDIVRVDAGGGYYSVFVNGGVGSAINVFTELSGKPGENIGQIVGNSEGGYGIFATGAAYAAYGGRSVVQKDNYWQWTVPPGDSKVAFIRVTGGTGINYDGTSHNKLIVTINEEI